MICNSALLALSWQKCKKYSLTFHIFGDKHYNVFQAHKKLFEKGDAEFAPGPYAVKFFQPVRRLLCLETHGSPEKAKAEGGGGGGTPTLFLLLLLLTNLGSTFQTQGRGIFIITNLYNKQAKKKSFSLPNFQKGCAVAPIAPPLRTGLVFDSIPGQFPTVQVLVLMSGFNGLQWS